MLNDTEITVLRLINEYGKHDDAVRQSRLSRREYFSVTMKLDALGAISYFQNRISVTPEFKKYLEWEVKVMLICGLIPIASFKDQVRTIKELQREFGKKVKISVQDNTIWYEAKQK